MADISREEIDAKLQREDVLREAHMAEVRSKFDVIIARLDAHDLRFERLEQGLRDAVTSIGNLKGTVIITGVSSVIAVTLGMAGFNAALRSNMKASFESGKETGQWQSDMRKQAEETHRMNAETRQLIEESKRANQENAALLKETRAQLDSLKQERASGKK